MKSDMKKKCFGYLICLVLLFAISNITGCGKKDTGIVADSATESVQDADEMDNSNLQPADNNDTELQDDAEAGLFENETRFTDEIFEYYASNDWQKAYKKVLEDNYIKVDDANYTSYLLQEYYLYDIDKDNIPELMIKHGTCEADYVTEVYHMDGKDAVLVGDFGSGHTALYTYPNANGLVQFMAHMGYAGMYHIALKDNKLVFGDKALFEEDINTKLVDDSDADYTKVNSIVADAEVLTAYKISYTYGLLEYVGPLSLSSKLSHDELASMMDEVIDGSEKFYGVNAEPLYDEDIAYFNGEMDINVLYMDGVIFDCDDNKITIKDKYYDDFNDDGYEECLVVFQDNANQSEALVLFSYQNGKMFAYITRPLYNYDLVSENANIYAYGKYIGCINIRFVYCLDQATIKRALCQTTVLSDEAKESLVCFRQDLEADRGELGVAFLGWCGYYAETSLADLFDGAAVIYSDEAFMGELNRCTYVSCPGEEVYLLVPAKDSYCIKIYSQIWGEETEDGMPKRGELLYEGGPGELVIVKGNQSDIVSNIEVSMDVNGSELIYNPSLSLENGKLSVIDKVVDFSREEP